MMFSDMVWPLAFNPDSSGIPPLDGVRCPIHATRSRLAAAKLNLALAVRPEPDGLHPISSGW